MPPRAVKNGTFDVYINAGKAKPKCVGTIDLNEPAPNTYDYENKRYFLNLIDFINRVVVYSEVK